MKHRDKETLGTAHMHQPARAAAQNKQRQDVPNRIHEVPPRAANFAGAVPRKIHPTRHTKQHTQHNHRAKKNVPSVREARLVAQMQHSRALRSRIEYIQGHKNEHAHKSRMKHVKQLMHGASRNRSAPALEGPHRAGLGPGHVQLSVRPMTLSETTIMITIHNVCFSYSGAPATLQDISLSIPAGSIVVLAGANGSGKTTLLSLLAGLLSPQSGSITRGPITTPGDEKAFRRSAGLLLQDADLQILGSTVEEDLLLGGTGPQRRAAAHAMAQRFDVLQQWQTPVQHLSWGQKRKLCLAATLLREPEFLLLDEPLSGLDYPGMREMRKLIEDSKEAGLTQIITSHDLAPLVDLADIIAVMHCGRLVRAGRPEEVLDGIAEYGVRPPDCWTMDRTLRRWE